ncbi:hypothetical protein UUU_28690 [Klebsiella pneumoniae subsp. pneumoniae DSM 30104 = JCM 1662 = NBRC 14940]|nr:hypothetical protein UUU_28690 [Klebsiella pneumoniae subsp. pneumoniae DSM 30104 = JCM 1662 = NBRC 14940]
MPNKNREEMLHCRHKIHICRQCIFTRVARSEESVAIPPEHHGDGQQHFQHQYPNS